jgi:hypothetical protein
MMVDYYRRVLLFLRLLGMANAAIWFGASIGYLCVFSPGFFSDEMRDLLPFAHRGAAELVLRERFFFLQYVCSAVGVAHLLIDWLYAGRPLRRWTAYLLGTLVVLAIVGGLGIQPRMQNAHRAAYGQTAPAEKRDKAARVFRSWQITSQVLGVVSVIGLATYVWQVSGSGPAPRFSPAPKYRGWSNPVS